MKLWLSNRLISAILRLNGWRMIDGAWQRSSHCYGGSVVLRGGWKYAMQHLEFK